MTQAELFEQQQNLARVRVRIGSHVLAFWRQRLEAGPFEFHAEDLLRFVRGRVPDVAPDSPRRILGELRRQGALGYEVLNRRASLYRALPLGEEQKPRRSALAELRRALAEAHAALDAAGIPRPSAQRRTTP